ncbi:MAG: glycosyltransferase [Actinobacteria bacterium]|nr:glycosyltransferase [Actinomycetota bacterium]
MKIVMFVHSLLSDWNHGNAHFLRGVVSELLDRGHDVDVYEPQDGWSRQNLVERQGQAALDDVAAAFPHLRSTDYDLESLDLDAVLDGAALVLAHEWNEPELIAALGMHRRGAGYRLLFHDTHHRVITEPDEIQEFDLSHYDGVLAFGKVIADLYLERAWAKRAWTWHEAADTRVFWPRDAEPDRDLVWIGNWGDEERTRELDEFLLGPAKRLELTGTVHGVRYPGDALERIADTKLQYAGWIANHRVPEQFARHRLTLHVPRRPYVMRMTGIPTIRVFEALACGIPLICAPWEDSEELFRPGTDYLVAASGAEMERRIDDVRSDPGLAADLRRAGLETIRSRHTCAHRVDELLAIYEDLS